MTMELRVRGTAEEQLLFLLLGIAEREDRESCALLLGLEAEAPDREDPVAYLRLPDPNNPLEETDRLARELGQAIGLGRVQL